MCSYQYMYDGHKRVDPVLSDDNNNNPSLRSNVLSSEFCSTTEQGLTVLAKAAFDSHRDDLSDNFCLNVNSGIESGEQNCDGLETYLSTMQGISSVGEIGTEVNRNASISFAPSDAEMNQQEKRQGHSRYVGSPEKDKQYIENHSTYSSNIRGSLSSNTLATQSKSRGVDVNAEVSGIENGVASHTQAGNRMTSRSGATDEAKNLSPRANFGHTSHVQKPEQSVGEYDSQQDKANTIINVPEEGTVSEEQNLNLLKEVGKSTARLTQGSDISSVRLSSLVQDLMSPDQNSGFVRRSSANDSFESGNMPSASINSGPNMSVDMDLNSNKEFHHQSKSTDKKSEADDHELVSCAQKAINHETDDDMESVRVNEATVFGEDDRSHNKKKNGESDKINSEHKDSNSTAKHIYPWMKESRQNARRKHSTSSNASNNSDKPSKRERTAYTNSQLVELEKEFHFNRYLCRPRRIEMAQMLNLTERQIKIWFQNRRMKYKKDQKMKIMPMNSLHLEGSFYHQHHHSQNTNSEALFSRSNDHRHYSHSGHMHQKESPFRSNHVEGTAMLPSGMDCSSGGRCYHGHRHQTSHFNQDSSNMIRQPLPRANSHPFDVNNKVYPNPNQQGSSGGRMASPSSSSSTGTLSPGNGRSSGGFGSEVGVRSTASSGSETQPLSQSGCGFLSHAASPTTKVSEIDEESSVIHNKNNSTEYLPETDSRRFRNRSSYDAAMTSQLPSFPREVDNATTIAHFNGGSFAMPKQYLDGMYERTKNSAHEPVFAESNHLRGSEHAGYAQFHHPLESLSDCVHRSPREFAQQRFAERMFANNVRNLPPDAYHGASSRLVNGTYRSSESSPLDFSRSKSGNGPRSQVAEAYVNNRLTHL
uniref:uncharacterized protein LOC120343000 n=1 Tax=Styela clava TaxID=7725 RepID=UPI001939BF60|nr:uncharacterized protein LOC120343000 [Styela clava]XP_039267998.1 uncharacterized protein LOC120343000 [Styela clava]XP_039267999.1 uncharacterized protein LOC120343000 [Styela clava]